MTQHVFKFMQAITQTVTPIFNSTLQIGDTFTTIFSKIQGLLTTAGCRFVLTSPVVGGASSTADVTMGTLVIPAGEYQAGTAFDIWLHGYWSKPNSGTNIVRVWVKANGTNVASVNYSTNAVVTNQPISFAGKLVVRNVSAAGSAIGGIMATFHNSASTVVQRVSLDSPAVINGLNPLTITVGIGFGTFNAGNQVTAQSLCIVQE